jgi:hypothetical protein
MSKDICFAEKLPGSVFRGDLKVLLLFHFIEPFPRRVARVQQLVGQVAVGPDFLSWEKHRRVKRASGQGFLGEREGSKL